MVTMQYNLTRGNVAEYPEGSANISPILCERQVLSRNKKCTVFLFGVIDGALPNVLIPLSCNAG